MLVLSTLVSAKTGPVMSDDSDDGIGCERVDYQMSVG
jgi:hypothetical protein